MIVGTADAPEDVVCNKCGETLAVPISTDGHENFEGVELQVRWGYGSKKDLTVHRGHICERCYDEYVATWKIPPETGEYGGAAGLAADPLPRLRRWWRK